MQINLEFREIGKNKQTDFRKQAQLIQYKKYKFSMG